MSGNFLNVRVDCDSSLYGWGKNQKTVCGILIYYLCFKYAKFDSKCYSIKKVDFKKSVLLEIMAKLEFVGMVTK